MTEPIVPPADTPPETPPPPTRRRGPLGRLGCALGLLVWLVLILSPCLVFTLATQGEITVTVGGAPGQSARLWLVMEANERGLGLSLPTAQTSAEGDAVCVQTDVRYLLWQGQAESVSYCECYRRAADEAPWDFVTTIEGSCTADALASAASQP